MDNTLTSLISNQLPRLTELLGSRKLGARKHEFERLGMSPLWQVEKDLELLIRHLPCAKIAAAYRELLQNAGQFLAAMYEIRVAAMLAPIADKLELAPTVGAAKCDLKCECGGQEVFFEVTTREDTLPPGYESDTIADNAPFYGRVTVEASFDPTTARENPNIRGIPASQELRQRTTEELHQLPSGKPTVLVVGVRGAHSLDMESALWGDEVYKAHSLRHGIKKERVPNGLFCLPDDMGGTSRISALVWMKLVPHFHDVRVHSRLFTNPRAAHPLSPEIEEIFRKLFDRRETLLRELERIKRKLVEQYRPERLILFGSLADDSPDAVHEWSDIDLAIVKSTPASFLDRIREVMDLLQPRVGLNVIVYTPEEFHRAEQEGDFFVKDEILGKGYVLFSV
jgi:predicted nucleotidyltransferase